MIDTQLDAGYENVLRMIRYVGEHMLRPAGLAADRRGTPSDIARTVYHTMGIHDLSATDSQDRPYNLQEDGRPLLELL